MDLLTATSLTLQLTNQLQQLALIMQKAQTEGRPGLSDDEVDALVGQTEAARLRLHAAIVAATQAKAA